MNEQEVRKILKKALTSACLYCRHTQIDNYKIDRTLASLKSLEPKVEEIKGVILHCKELYFDECNGVWCIERLNDLATAIVEYLKGRP